MKKDIMELKKTVANLVEGKPVEEHFAHDKTGLIPHFEHGAKNYDPVFAALHEDLQEDEQEVIPSEIINETLSLQKKEMDLIRLALEKHKGKRKNAANELGISERTLYRKIKEYNIDL